MFSAERRLMDGDAQERDRLYARAQQVGEQGGPRARGRGKARQGDGQREREGEGGTRRQREGGGRGRGAVERAQGPPEDPGSLAADPGCAPALGAAVNGPHARRCTRGAAPRLPSGRSARASAVALCRAAASLGRRRPSSSLFCNPQTPRFSQHTPRHTRTQTHIHGRAHTREAHTHTHTRTHTQEHTHTHDIAQRALSSSPKTPDT
jgi:hypothetical protein